MNYYQIYKTFRRMVFTFIALAFTLFSHAQDSLKVTYIANEGFLITTSTHKILFDAIFSNGSGKFYTPPADILVKERNATSPFDSVDLIFTSHSMADHVDPAYLIEHMGNNPVGFLLATTQLNAELKLIDGFDTLKDRIRSIEWKNNSRFDTTINNIAVKSYSLMHANGNTTMQNIGYTVKMDGLTLFHSGDSDPAILDTFQLYNLSQDSIDIAFIHRGFFDNGSSSEGVQILNYLNPKAIIIMHIKIGEFDEYRTKVEAITNIPTVYFMEEQMGSLKFVKNEQDSLIIDTASQAATQIVTVREDDIIAWPNPATGKVYMKSERSFIGGQLFLFTSDGNSILSKPVKDASDLFIDFAGYPKGIYYLVLSGKDYNCTKKICVN